jgi:hypothetical protein
MACCNIGKASIFGEGVTVIVRSGKEVRAIPATICSIGLGSGFREHEGKRIKRTEKEIEAKRLRYMGRINVLRIIMLKWEPSLAPT